MAVSGLQLTTLQNPTWIVLLCICYCSYQKREKVSHKKLGINILHFFSIFGITITKFDKKFIIKNWQWNGVEYLKIIIKIIINTIKKYTLVFLLFNSTQLTHFRSYLFWFIKKIKVLSVILVGFWRVVKIVSICIPDTPITWTLNFWQNFWSKGSLI